MPLARPQPSPREQELRKQHAQFLNVDIEDLIDQLSVEEKINLLGAPDWWSTTAVDRLDIPSVRMSDGPNGVRGSSHFLSHPAQCIPCATSLASTFDTELITQVGQFLASETKLKAAVILLAPTCNIQRNPLAGRSFESFSEDPHLSGMMAAAYVNGLQQNGVSATMKHFVANDQEHERTAADSVVSERALREIYLYPFMIAQKYSNPWAFMTSYGRIDGVHCAENPRLLQSILRDEWGFDGLVMSDWFGTYSVAEALKAGLDLEMPGPPRWRNPLLVTHMLSSQKLQLSTIDERVRTIVNYVQRCAKASPEVVWGDGVERDQDTLELRRFNRRVASSGMVLLKNENELLPLEPSAANPKKIAVIGPNAKGRVISGGGSAYIKATYIVSPWAGLLNDAPEGVTFDYQVGCYAHKFLPTLEDKLTTPEGESGWLCIFYNQDAEGQPTEEVARFVLQDTRVKLNDFLPAGLGSQWMIKLVGRLTVDTTGPFELGLTVAGRANLYINGELLIDNWTKQRPGEFFYGQGSVEEKAIIETVAGKSVDVMVEYVNTSPPDSTHERDLSQPALMLGVRLGGAEKIDPDQAIKDAANLARNSDAAVIVVGLNHEWESEGFDRPSLALPGRQAELIRQVGKANPNTIVVVQSGSAVDYTWAGSVSSIIQAWYSGNEAGNAIADVLFGRVNPSGRMPISFPKQVEDIPAWYNTKSINGKIHYQEDILVGYKHYQARKVIPQWAFGSGMSYTTFDVSNLRISEPITIPNTSPHHQSAASSSANMQVTASVTVTNTGKRTGREVVQLYIQHPSSSLVPHPPIQLKAFAKTGELAPGESEELVLGPLDRHALSFWDEPNGKWRVEKGDYGVKVGTSSMNLPLSGIIAVKKGAYWTGL